jgi:hypothetical protein
MILSIAGQLEFFICSECHERWVGQGGEPRTQEWLAAHDQEHQVVADYKVVSVPNAPRGFDRPGIL